MDLWKKFERQHVDQKRGCNLTFVFFPTDYDVIRHIRDDPPGLDLRCICSGTTRFKCLVRMLVIRSYNVMWQIQMSFAENNQIIVLYGIHSAAGEYVQQDI